MNMHGVPLNKLFGNCYKTKQTTLNKPENAINSTNPGILDEIARPGLFPDYEYDSAVFTPQSGTGPDQSNINVNPPLDKDVIVAAIVDGVRKREIRELLYGSRSTTTGCCPDVQFQPHSGAVESYDCKPGPMIHKEHNVRFRDKEEHCILEVGHGADSVHTARDTNDVSLNAFFSRPLLMETFEWDTYTPLEEVFVPWVYFSVPSVKARLANFKNLRARLHVKFMINGNSFLYGRAMASYLPLPLTNDFETSESTKVDAVIESQRPRVFLDPCTSQGGELVLPFFWNESYFDLSNNAYLEAGKIILRDLAQLRHASGASGSCTVSVFVWASDVQLSGLTHTPQSGVESEIDQANRTGSISRPASAVANIAGKLQHAPYIGKYAKATQLGASAVAGIATSFGYSRPPLTACPTPMRPTPMSSLATVTTPDLSHKLTMDDKQELTIDPTTTGLSSVDEMSIKEIAKKESWIYTAEWPKDASPGTMLFNTAVTPVLWRTRGTNDTFNLTACGYATLPFTYWSGTLKFRIQVSASAFHRGRLRIVYDPVSTGDSEFNTVYSEIIDIADSMDFTITVSNNQSHDLLTYSVPCNRNDSFVMGTTPLTSVSGNGTLSIEVLNRLTTSDNDAEGNDAQIIVYVSADDDFEVYRPSGEIQRYSFLPQSGQEMSPEAQDTSQPSEPFHTEFDKLAMDSGNDNALTSIYIGESVKSFRQLAKRYTLWRTIPTASNATSNQYVCSFRHPSFPPLRGDPDFDDGWGYFNMTYQHWVRMPYAAWRGSNRYKAVLQNVQNSRLTSFVVGLVDNSLANYALTIGLAGISVDPKTVALEGFATDTNTIVTGLTGAAIGAPQNSNTLEYEIPYQEKVRFNRWKNEDMGADPREQGGARYRFIGQTDGAGKIQFWTAGGEDFATFFWVGPPTLTCIPSVPGT